MKKKQTKQLLIAGKLLCYEMNGILWDVLIDTGMVTVTLRDDRTTLSLIISL